MKALLSKLSMPLIIIALIAGMVLYMKHLSDKTEAQAAMIATCKFELEAGRQAIAALQEGLFEISEDIKASHKESVRVLEVLEKRTADNIKTTGALKNELAKTAAGRADCRFPASVMQLINEARERAAATAAGGLDAALPGSVGAE